MYKRQVQIRAGNAARGDNLPLAARAERHRRGAAGCVVLVAFIAATSLALPEDGARARQLLLGPLQVGQGARRVVQVFDVIRPLDPVLAVVGSLGCRPADYPELIELVRSKRVQLEPLVTGRYPLEEIARGLDALRRGEGLRGIVLPGETAA